MKQEFAVRTVLLTLSFLALGMALTRHYQTFACSCAISHDFERMEGTISAIDANAGTVSIKERFNGRIKTFLVHPSTSKDFAVGDRVRIQYNPVGNFSITLNKMTKVSTTQNFTHR